MSAARALAAAALLSAAGAASGQALEVGGSLGGGYLRTDAWSDGQALQGSPAWNWFGTLDLAGSPVRPGLFQVAGSAQYQGGVSRVGGLPSDSRGLTYSATSVVLGDAPVSFGLSAERTKLDFTANVNTRETGTTWTTQYGARSTLSGANLPGVTVGFDRVERENQSFGRSDLQTSDYLRARVGQRLQSYQYSLTFDGNDSAGSFADSNYRSRSATADITAALAPDVEARFSDLYTLRIPTVEAVTNPRLESQTLNTGLVWGRETRLTQQANYSYGRSLLHAPDTRDQEQASHAASYTLNWQYTPEWSFNGSLQGARGVVGLGAEEQVATTGQLGAGLSWNRRLSEPLSVQVQAAATSGALVVSGGGAVPAYSGSATGSLTALAGAWQHRVGYQFSLGSNQGGVSGDSFGHTLSGSTSTASLLGGRFNAQLLASSARRTLSILGTSLERQVLLTAQLRWQRFSADAIAGFSDGLSGTLASPGFGDGLFLGPAYDSHTRHASLTVTHAATGALRFSLTGRALQTESPGHPATSEVGLSLLTSYDLGLVSLVVEERVTHGYAGNTPALTSNYLFARVVRRFGARF